MREVDKLFTALAKSAFSRKFNLQVKDLEYFHNKGLVAVLSHANNFISKRLAPDFPEKDDKQTPFQGHPEFVRNMQRPFVVRLSGKMASNLR